jgi:hypothetical protein
LEPPTIAAVSFLDISPTFFYWEELNTSLFGHQNTGWLTSLILSIFHQILGFIFGATTFLRNLIIGSEAPLRVIQDSIKLLGYEFLSFDLQLFRLNSTISGI